MPQCVVKHRQLSIPTIKPIGKLIAVAAQVPYRNFVIRAKQAAFKQAECILNRVGVNRVDTIRAAMIDCLMLTEVLPKIRTTH